MAAVQSPLKNPASATSARGDAVAVVRRLREAGHIAYFAGGCVRDGILGIPPTDFDIATDAGPDRVRAVFTRSQPIGVAFGVVLVHQRTSNIEVATFRSDGAYTDGRRPNAVTFSSPEQDAQRRDFTINGLFLDPLDGDRVIDFVGGVADLKSRTLRAIGEPAVRFADDHLRLLRAVRFAARFSLTIDPGTADAIMRDAPLLKRISPERVGDELRRMLRPPSRAVAWAMLRRFDLHRVLFRFLPELDSRSSRSDLSILAGLSTEHDVQIGLALAACAVEMGEDVGASVGRFTGLAGARAVATALRQSLKLSNDESAELSETLLGAGMILHEAGLDTLARRKRFLARTTAGLSRQLLQAVVQSSGFGEGRVARAEADLSAVISADVAPPPLLTGDNLVANGVAPGPRFKKILEAVYDAQLEGEIVTAEQALTRGLALARGAEMITNEASR